MLRSALRLAAQGLAVFPCCCRGKTPAVAGGLKAATTDRGQITTWWTANSDYNVAIATGEISNLLIVDVDGPAAELELLRLGLPATVEVITARGRHFYFKYPKASVRNSASKIARGIDIRATGGYCIAPPSVHESGHVYHWSGARTVAAAPDQLITKISERINRAATPAAEWQQLFTSDIPEGQRDCTLTRMAGKLLRHCVNAADVLGIVQSINIARCKPPLPPDDIERIVESIAERELKRRGHG
jgi:hypothetical protein